VWKKILVLVIVLLAVGAGIFFWGMSLSNEPVKVIQAQLAAIDNNDFATAYGYLAPQIRSDMPLEQYRGFIEQHSALLKGQHASFPFRQLYWRGGTFVFERGHMPRLNPAYLTDTLHADRDLNNVALIRGTLVAPSGESTRVRYLLMQEEDVRTGKDHWVIYDFALGKW